MAGDKRETKRQSERVVPSITKGSSRVSGAAGSVGSSRAQVTHAEQRSQFSANKRASSSSKSARGKNKGSGSRSSNNRAPDRGALPPLPDYGSETGDSQLIKSMVGSWNNLEAHQQQRFFSVLLLILSLLLFGSLTVFRNAPILKWFYAFFLAFLSWSAYLFALGLVAFAVAHLIEGIQKRKFVRWSLVIGLTCIWLLLLIESRLILGRGSVGILAELLVVLLNGWPAVVTHILVIGLLLIACIVTFRITFGHVRWVMQTIGTIIARDPRVEAEPDDDVAPYRGQRPQYSRYAVGMEDAQDVADNRMPPLPMRQGAKPSRSVRQVPVEEEDDADIGIIQFEDDFVGDDPQNDINLYKEQVGTVPKGLRKPNPAENIAPIQGANQPPLPFEDEEEEQPRIILSDNPAHTVSQMEPLQPNPNRIPGQGKKTARPAPPVAAPVVESPWSMPDTSLLHSPEEIKQQLLGDDTSTLARTIQETLRSFRVDAEVKPEDISIGPTVIRFGIRPTGKPEMTVDDKGRPIPVRDAAGNIIYETRTRVSRIMALQNDLALVLEAKTIRMEAPVPGRPYVGVEIPNKNSRLVTLREILESKEYLAAKAKSKLAIALGKDVAGLVRVGDLARMPHLLIAGATGAGKSVAINVIIASIITHATPEDVRLLMVDPKMVELNMYNGIPHLLSPVVTEVEKVVPLLRNAINEMEKRYRLFSQLGVRNLDGYRKMRAERLAKGDTSLNNMPAIVIIIDELADLMMAAPEEVEGMICRLAQLARATGIHLVIATQRPSVDVITGLIKANIPTRISFMVSSSVDSRTIIDMGGAERLLGRGDMLYLPADAGRPERIQCSFLADDEAETLVAFWRHQVAEHQLQAQGGNSKGNGNNNGTSDLALASTQPMVEPGWEIKEQAPDEFELDDDLLDEAEEVVREYGKASISLLQRRLRIGYSRAARLIDLLEEHGIIGHAEQGGRAREVFEETSNGGNGHSMADAAAEIVAEEKARDEFLKKQAQQQSNISSEEN